MKYLRAHIYSSKFWRKRHQNHQSRLKPIFTVFLKRSMRARVRYQRHVSLNVIIIVSNS